MKKKNLVNLISFRVFVILSCFCSIQNINAQNLSFGIYETVKLKEIPKEITENLQSKGIQMAENDEQPIVCYVQKSFTSSFNDSGIKLLSTIYTIDEKAKHYALIALSISPTMILSDIDKAEGKNNQVIIHFNWKGAKKWAELTRENTGGYLAFEIDNKVYSLTLVNKEIRNGMAIIGGFNNKETAQKVAEALNSSIPN